MEIEAAMTEAMDVKPNTKRRALMSLYPHCGPAAVLQTDVTRSHSEGEASVQRRTPHSHIPSSGRDRCPCPHHALAQRVSPRHSSSESAIPSPNPAATVSFDMEWSGKTADLTVKDSVNGFAGEYHECSATIQWSAQEAGITSSPT